MASAPTPTKCGVSHKALDNAVDDVTVVHETRLAQAKAAVATLELKAMMKKTGVKGTPRIGVVSKSAP